MTSVLATVLAAVAFGGWLRAAARLRTIERRAANLARHALRDPVTGLANRRAVERRLARCAHDPAAAVLFVDLDRFKGVNDLFGHAVGDAVLTDVGRALAAAAGPGALTGRWGGDEFVVVASDLPADEAVHELGRRLRAGVAAVADRWRVDLGASVGCARGGRSLSAVEVIAAADLAAYRAKASGGDRLSFAAPAPKSRASTSNRPPRTESTSNRSRRIESTSNRRNVAGNRKGADRAPAGRTDRVERVPVGPLG